MKKYFLNTSKFQLIIAEINSLWDWVDSRLSFFTISIEMFSTWSMFSFILIMSNSSNSLKNKFRGTLVSTSNQNMSLMLQTYFCIRSLIVLIKFLFIGSGFNFKLDLNLICCSVRPIWFIASFGSKTFMDFFVYN